MSSSVLSKVHDEMRRLAIAGSDLAAGDFRLKKLLPPLEAAAAKAPVVGKIAAAMKTLVESDHKTSAGALLELSTLVSAVLYTQGEIGIAGELVPIETSDFGLPSSTAGARVLKPLVEALTTTGSGREEVIKDAFERGTFKDLRLVRLAVAAMDDVYSPIAEFIAENVLPLYGRAIYDDLRAGYNVKGKGGHVRRLRLMHRLDAEKTHELVKEALESGSPEMKIAAIECLEGREESLSYLLEQARAKSADVRRAAYKALAAIDHDDAAGALIKGLSGNDLASAAEYARKSRSPRLLSFLLDETQRQLDALLTTTTDPEKQKKIAQIVFDLLSAFASRSDKETTVLLTKCFQQRDAITSLKGHVGIAMEINRRVALLLITTHHKPSLKILVDAHAILRQELLDCAMLAALLSRKPGEVYDLFSPYFLAKPKKKGDVINQKLDAVRSLLLRVARERDARGYYASDVDEILASGLADSVQLDPRWLDAAIATEDVDVVSTLARPDERAGQAFLSSRLEILLNKKGGLDQVVWQLLDTIIRVQHPRASEHFLATLNKVAGNKHQYHSYWLVRLIPSLPKSAAPEIEALLPTLDEKLADQIAPYLAELQSKP